MATTTTITLHLIDGAEDETHGLCGAAVKDWYKGMPVEDFDWTEERNESNCDACKEEYDSRNEPCCGACANEAMGVTEGGIPTRPEFLAVYR